MTNKWAGVTYSYFEFDIGASLGLGLNYTKQRGFAYDEVGKTKYTTKLTLYVSNQIKEALETDKINFVVGASVSATVNVKQNWKYETFLGATGSLNVDVGLPVPLSESKSGKAAAAVAINVGISNESLTSGAGLGLGIKIPIINTELIQSISLTDDQVNKVQKLAGVWNELNAKWDIKNPTAMRDENGVITSYMAELYTKNKKGAEVATGINVFSGAKINKIEKNGSTLNIPQPDNIWRSEDYQNKAVDAERNGGSIN